MVWVLLLLAVPVRASADHGCHSQIKATTYEMTLRGSNGYRIEIESSRSGKVALTAEKGTGFGGSFATYGVKGQSNERGLRADFGQLGRIAVHLRPQRKAQFPAEAVRLEGRIEFHGEQGFTSVSLRRARGVVSRTFKRACPAPPSGGPGRASGAKVAPGTGSRVMTFLAAGERTPGRAIFLGLQSSQPPLLEEHGGGDYLVASLEERREQISIRRAVTFDEPVAMVAGSPLGVGPFSVNVIGARPFSGTGTYSRASGSPTSWSGDLTVSLPGAMNVPLTGPGFSVVACGDNERTNLREICEGEIEALAEATLLFPL